MLTFRSTVVAALTVALAACGGDDTPANPPPAKATPTAAAGGVGAGGKKELADRLHIEDRVVCPIPDKPTDPKDGKCDPKAPDCAAHSYCLQLNQGYFCEPCPERDGIRHAFKDRDFAFEQNRDPFQSFLFPQLIGPKSDNPVPLDPTKKCLRDDQMVASSYSYADLKLVGIVAQGTQRKVLMMGGPRGYIIKRGDCVGKEKAVVKDIGAGFITFLVEPDTTGATVRNAQEYAVQLHPAQLQVDTPPSDQPLPKTTITPIIPPPPTLPPSAPGLPPRPAMGSAAEMPPVVAPPTAPPAKR